MFKERLQGYLYTKVLLREKIRKFPGISSFCQQAIIAEGGRSFLEHQAASSSPYESLSALVWSGKCKNLQRHENASFFGLNKHKNIVIS